MSCGQKEIIYILWDAGARPDRFTREAAICNPVEITFIRLLLKEGVILRREDFKPPRFGSRLHSEEEKAIVNLLRRYQMKRVGKCWVELNSRALLIACA